MKTTATLVVSKTIMDYHAYLITMKGCGPCKKAVEALKKAQPMYEPVLDIVDKDDPRVMAFAVNKYPTLIIWDDYDKKVAAQIEGANNLTEEFWGKAFIVTPKQEDLI